MGLDGELPCYRIIELPDLPSCRIATFAMVCIISAETQTVTAFGEVQESIRIIPHLLIEEPQAAGNVVERFVFDIDRDSAQCRDNIKRALTQNLDAATPHIFHDITPCGGNYDNTRLGDKTRCLVVCGNDTLRQFRADLKECDGPGGVV